MPLSNPIPFSAQHPGCGAGVRIIAGQWSHCRGVPVWAGPRSFRHRPRIVWLAFACELHRDLLDDARPLTDADRAELEHRREQDRRAMAGMLFERVRPLRGPTDTRL